jgi:hypothetical protein
VYLVWALVAGLSRHVVQEMIKSAAATAAPLPRATMVVKAVFLHGAILIDLVGLAWLGLSLYLVVRGSRQRASISWAWVSAVCQALVAAVGAVLVGWAAYKPHILPVEQTPTTWEQIRYVSLPVVMVIAVLLWVTFLVWLLIERARLNRRGPTLSDGLRTNVYR